MQCLICKELAFHPGIKTAGKLGLRLSDLLLDIAEGLMHLTMALNVM